MQRRHLQGWPPIVRIPVFTWTPTVDALGGHRDGVDVVEGTGMLDLRSWPAGMRVLIRSEHPQRARPADVEGTASRCPGRPPPPTQCARLSSAHPGGHARLPRAS